jgi:methylmalonyl-CoA/ethylmalonyl-CoA epimerase
MNSLRLHDIGFVVASVESSIPGFVQSLGAYWNGRIFEDPHQKVKVTFLTTRPEDAQVELVAPVGQDSPVQRFLRDTGGGLHHACYEVVHLEEELADFRARGAVIAKRPKPAVAFDGRRIAWVITAEKFLVELLEAGGRNVSPTNG